jgi:Tfp pilus assembly protein PilO
MYRDFTFRRRLIVGSLAVLLLADAGLAVYSWHLATMPKTPDYVLAQETRQLKVLSGEIDRARKIKENLPATMADCDRFEKSLLPASSGYSVVTAELGDLAKKSGLNLNGISFHQTAVKERPLESVEMDAEVTGDYLGVVKFVNGLQRSQDVFIVESLALGAESGFPGQSPTGGAPIRVKVRLETYFRT